jgi:hypothetical protein
MIWKFTKDALQKKYVKIIQSIFWCIFLLRSFVKKKIIQIFYLFLKELLKICSNQKISDF